MGSVLTTGLDGMVTTDSQEKLTAEMLSSYNVTFYGSLVFCRMHFFKTGTNMPEREKKPYFNGIFYLCWGINVLLCMANLHSDGEMLFWLSPFLKRLLCSSCSQHKKPLMFYHEAAKTIAMPNYFFFFF